MYNDESNEISFSKEGLSNALSNFNEIATTITQEIDSIQKNLDLIEQNWTGTIHNSANADKVNADENLKTAMTIVSNMGTALSKVSENANKVNYGE